MWQVGADVLKDIRASVFLCTLKTEMVIPSETLVVAYKVTTRCCK